MPQNPFDKPKEIAARTKASHGGGLLDGLTKPAKKPAQSGGFLVTEREEEDLRGGKTPAGWSKGKDGRPRPMVQ